MIAAEPQVPAEVNAAIINFVESLSQDRAGDIINQVNLWLAASWKQAQALGMNEREYCRWIRVGLWNIAGDSTVARNIEVYRALGGRRGHLIPLAGISAEAAVEQAKESGISALIEGCEAVVGLMDLGSDLIDETDSEPAQPPKPSERIDFS